jgi:hypothetical protein
MCDLSAVVVYSCNVSVNGYNDRCLDLLKVDNNFFTFVGPTLTRYERTRKIADWNSYLSEPVQQLHDSRTQSRSDYRGTAPADSELNQLSYIRIF